MEKTSPQTKRRRRSATRRVVMADVAQAAGVSAQTVSRVLSQPDMVGDEVRDRVQAAIERLQYVPNFAASQMASNRSGIVAAIIPSISSSIFAETVQGLSDVLLPAGYQILLGNAEYDPVREEELVRSLLGRGPDGIMLASTVHTPALVNLLKASTLPVVETWDWSENPIDLLVGYSNENAAQEMVKHLQTRGYRNIVFAGVTNPGDYRAEARLRGYQKAVGALGLGMPKVFTMAGKELLMQHGGEAMHAVRETFPEVDAIFFSSDIFAAGALLECQRSGILVPDQLGLAGFGDFEIAHNLIPRLTTISIPTARIGQLAADLLLARMRKEVISQPWVDVGFELIAREST